MANLETFLCYFAHQRIGLAVKMVILVYNTSVSVLRSSDKRRPTALTLS